MKRTAEIISPEDHGEELTVIGASVTVLLSNATTGSHEITLQSGEEGKGPPPHSHEWDESFFVLEGSIQFFCNGESITCPKGTLVHIPGGTVHGFSYGKGGGKMLEIAGKGGNATRLFEDLHKQVPPGPPDIDKVLKIFDTHGVTAHL